MYRQAEEEQRERPCQINFFSLFPSIARCDSREINKRIPPVPLSFPNSRQITQKSFSTCGSAKKQRLVSVFMGKNMEYGGENRDGIKTEISKFLRRRLWEPGRSGRDFQRVIIHTERKGIRRAVTTFNLAKQNQALSRSREHNCFRNK